MTDLPKLTPQTRAAAEFGHRYLAAPLIERMRARADLVERALADGRPDDARAAVADMRRQADDQERWTRELLNGAAP